VRILIACTGIVSAVPATYSGGSGTEVDPYQLSNNNDIETLSYIHSHWSKSFTLTQNITLEGNHTLIGNLDT
jgi:hypothetical protein